MNQMTTRNAAGARRGFTMTELIVAATLLISVLSVAAPWVVRNGRIRHDARRQLVALDELSNQIDRLTALDQTALRQALDQLQPSADTQRVLPNAVFEAKVVTDAAGRRLALGLSWDRPGNPPPLTLVGWFNAAPADDEELTQ